MRKDKCAGFLICVLTSSVMLVTASDASAGRLFRSRHRAATPCYQPVVVWAPSCCASVQAVSPFFPANALPGDHSYGSTTSRVIRVGSFPGRWHGDPVSFDFQKVYDAGKFKGVGTFTSGPHDGIQFAFTGQLFGFGTLTIRRDVAGGTQTASAGEWLVDNEKCYWHAPTTGPGAGDRAFELRVPSLVKIGSFDGQWHGDPVTFKFVQIFETRQFNGIAKFTGGPHNGIEFGFSGFMKGSGGVSIKRETGVGTQSASVDYAMLAGSVFMWHGPTVGPGAGGRWFELRIPE